MVPVLPGGQRQEHLLRGITDESFLRLTFASGRAKRQQMEIFCRTKNCEKCELYTAINARYADD